MYLTHTMKDGERISWEEFSRIVVSTTTNDEARVLLEYAGWSVARGGYMEACFDLHCAEARNEALWPV